MKTRRLLWIPRVLAIVSIVFLTLFGLDEFSGDAPFLEELGGFIIHSIPSIILVLILLVSWKKPLIGGSLFILFSIVSTLFFRTYRFPSTFLLLTFPFLLAGLLFVLFDLAAKKSEKPA
jgi:hypothetical protein